MKRPQQRVKVSMKIKAKDERTARKIAEAHLKRLSKQKKEVVN